MDWSVPSSGRSSSNHSKPSVDSTAPARPRNRSSKRSCLSFGTVIALILTTLMGSPFPARRAVNHPGRVIPQRTADLGFAQLDPDRAARTGTPEVVYAAGKTPAQTVGCLAGLLDAGAPLAWATRVDTATADAVRSRWPDAVIDEAARCAFVGRLPDPVGEVLVLTAGTSDGPVAAEVAATLTALGTGCRRVDDVGVAGVHRVLAVVPDLAAAD